VARLKQAGRVEVDLTVSSPSDLGRPRRGTLSLEPPDRVRLDFPETGERIALRADGGEWLQPVARQLVVLKPGQLEAARELWGLFLHPDGAGYAERRVGARRYLLTRRSAKAELPDSVTIVLGRDGLPCRLETIVEAQDRQVYELRGWHFGAPRGIAGFRLRAPPGVTVVELP
jgi:hypothetical protein